MDGKGIGDEGACELAKALEGNTVLKRLNLRGNNIGTAGAVALADALKVNMALTELYVDSEHRSRIDRALQLAKDRRALMTSMGPAPVVQPRLFVCGREYAGKTSLVKSLQRGWFESLLASSDKPADRAESSIVERTRGVDVSVMRLGDKARFSVWDYAGQPHYYATHELFLAAEQAVFVLVSRLSEERAKREQDLEYWLRFIATRFAQEDNIKPLVILVFSHPDEKGADAEVVKGKSGLYKSPWAERAAAHFRGIFSSRLYLEEKIFVLNCNDARSLAIKSLRALLCAVYDFAVARATEVPGICNEALKILPQLRKAHAGFAPVDALSHEFLKSSVPFNPALCEPLLRYLTNVGEVIWFGESEATRDTVVVNPSWLCWEVIGKILMPIEFGASGTPNARNQQGVLSVSECTTLLKFSPEVTRKVLAMLAQLNLCVLLPSSQEDDASATATAPRQEEEHYLFPATLTAKREVSALWAKAEGFAVVCGRRWECQATDAVSMFTAGFFPGLQALVQREFSATSRVQLWNGQIALDSENDCVQALVLLRDDMRAVEVWVRCGGASDETLKCKQLLTQLLDLMETCRARSCPGTAVIVRCVNPAALRSSNIVMVTPSVRAAAAAGQAAGPGAVLATATEQSEKEIEDALKANKLTDMSAVLLETLGDGRSQRATVRELFPFNQNVQTSSCTDFDVFLSHNWGLDCHGRDNHGTVREIEAGLTERGLKVWLDEQQFAGGVGINHQMAEAIDASGVVVCCLTQAYMAKVTGDNQSDNCMKEFDYATLHLTRARMTAVPMEDNAAVTTPRRWPRVVGMELGHHLFPATFGPAIMSDPTRRAAALDGLAQRIRELCTKYGVGVVGRPAAGPAAQAVEATRGAAASTLPSVDSGAGQPLAATAVSASADAKPKVVIMWL